MPEWVILDHINVERNVVAAYDLTGGMWSM